jgi:hypothetical protein
MLDGEQVEEEPLSSCKRLGADVRIAHQGPMPSENGISSETEYT